MRISWIETDPADLGKAFDARFEEGCGLSLERAVELAISLMA